MKNRFLYLTLVLSILIFGITFFKYVIKPSIFTKAKNYEECLISGKTTKETYPFKCKFEKLEFFITNQLTSNKIVNFKKQNFINLEEEIKFEDTKKYFIDNKDLNLEICELEKDTNNLYIDLDIEKIEFEKINFKNVSVYPSKFYLELTKDKQIEAFFNLEDKKWYCSKTDKDYEKLFNKYYKLSTFNILQKDDFEKIEPKVISLNNSYFIPIKKEEDKCNYYNSKNLGTFYYCQDVESNGFINFSDLDKSLFNTKKTTGVLASTNVEINEDQDIKLINSSNFGKFNKVIYPKSESKLNQNLSDFLNSISTKEFKIPILMYHYISKPPEDSDNTRKQLSVSAETFEKQVKQLKEKGFNFVTMEQVSLALEGKGSLPNNPIVLTFDDGHIDHYINAFKILKEQNAVGTFFVITGFIDNKKDYYLTWDMVKEMHKEGMEIMPHSVDHLDLSSLSYEQQKYQINHSTNRLIQQLGIKHKIFAYPYGKYNADSISILIDGNYDSAVTTAWGNNQSLSKKYELKRIKVGENTEF